MAGEFLNALRHVLDTALNEIEYVKSTLTLVSDELARRQSWIHEPADDIVEQGVEEPDEEADEHDEEQPPAHVDSEQPSSSHKVTTVLVDQETGTVRWQGKKAALTAKPARLLALLASRCPDAVSYREIEDTVWGEGEAAERQQISAHLRRVVKALSEIDPVRAQIAVEVRPGLGLRLRPAYEIEAASVVEKLMAGETMRRVSILRDEPAVASA